MVDWEKLFEAASSYDDYLDRHASPTDMTRWQGAFERIQLGDDHTEVLGTFKRQMHVLCMSGTWCGDCVDQCPILEAFSRATECIKLRFIDRDENAALRDALMLCGAPRVPQAVFLSEDFQFVSHFGDRTFARYRQMGASVGGPTCSTGLVTDAGDPAFDAVVQEWLNEFERAHWILRSPRDSANSTVTEVEIRRVK